MFVLGYFLFGVLFALWIEWSMSTEVAQELMEEGYLPMMTNGMRVVFVLLWPYFAVMAVIEFIKTMGK